MALQVTVRKSGVQLTDLIGCVKIRDNHRNEGDFDVIDEPAKPAPIISTLLCCRLCPDLVHGRPFGLDSCLYRLRKEPLYRLPFYPICQPTVSLSSSPSRPRSPLPSGNTAHHFTNAMEESVRKEGPLNQKHEKE